ncbi:alpha/beta hydrolase [archaeon]|nr:MAG: alpha/beta hydrolase [archaeon]
MSLAFRTVGAPAASHVTAIVHGLLGNGRNWASMANELSKRTPAAAVACLDLRNHGRSVGFTAPHTLSTAAADVWTTLPRLHETGALPSRLIGHSMGGKVLMQLVADETRAAQLVQRSPTRRVDLFVVDSQPGAAPDEVRVERASPPRGATTDTVRHVLDFVSSAPHPLPSRAWVTERALAHNFGRGIAMWLASNVTQREDGAGLRWMFDPATAYSLFDSYNASDMWPLLIRGSVPGLNITLITATRSTRWKDAAVQAQLAHVQEAAAARRAQGGSAVRGDVRVVPIEAGHWVHVDNPSALLDVLCDVPTV